MNRKRARGDDRTCGAAAAPTDEDLVGRPLVGGESLDGDLEGQPGISVGFEIAVVGDLSEHEVEITERLLAVPPGGRCTLYFNSPGGSAYTAMSIASLISIRQVEATAVVTGECSSAAIWVFAACRRRFVAPHSVFLFHPLKWQSEEHVELREAAEWARHFGELEESMDGYLAQCLDLPHAQLCQWMRPGRYLSGLELVAAGVAELVEPIPPGRWPTVSTSQPRRRRRPKAAVST